MKKINLDDLSLSELKQLEKNVAKAIDGFQARQKREALAAVEAKAKEMGFTLTELTTNKKPRAVGVPKYQHPDNPEITWTGKGRQPEWIKKAEAAGKSRDAFLIS